MSTETAGSHNFKMGVTYLAHFNYHRFHDNENVDILAQN